MTATRDVFAKQPACLDRLGSNMQFIDGAEISISIDSFVLDDNLVRGRSNLAILAQSKNVVFKAVEPV